MDKYAEQINELFKLGLDTGGDTMSKVAEELSDYIKMEIREEAFHSKILPQEQIDKTDLIPEIKEDTFYTIEELEPDSSAVLLNLRSQPESYYFKGKRAKVEFFSVGSKRSEKSQTELLAYKMPITRVLQENDIKEMYKVEDRRFYTLMKKAAIANGLNLDVSATAGGKLNQDDFADALKLHSGVKLKTTQVLMTESRFYDVLKWDAALIGHSFKEEVTKKGWSEAEIFGKRLIVTNKSDSKPLGAKPADDTDSVWTDLFDDEIWFFTAPAYMGKNYIRDKINFDLGKKGRIIYWESWEDIAMAILNQNSVARLVINRTP